MGILENLYGRDDLVIPKDEVDTTEESGGGATISVRASDLGHEYFC